MLPAACRLPQSPPCALLPGSYSGYQLARLLPGAEAPHFAPGTPEFPLPGAGTPHFALGRQKKCCRAAASAGRPEIIFRAGLPENQFPLRPPQRPRTPPARGGRILFCPRHAKNPAARGRGTPFCPWRIKSRVARGRDTAFCPRRIARNCGISKRLPPDSR